MPARTDETDEPKEDAMKSVIVRYKVKPESAEENAALLAAEVPPAPAGLSTTARTISSFISTGISHP